MANRSNDSLLLSIPEEGSSCITGKMQHTKMHLSSEYSSLLGGAGSSRLAQSGVNQGTTSFESGVLRRKDLTGVRRMQNDIMRVASVASLHGNYYTHNKNHNLNVLELN